MQRHQLPQYLLNACVVEIGEGLIQLRGPIKGINIIPSRVGDILEEIQGIRPPCQLVVERVHYLDKLTLLVEVSEDLFFDKMGEQRSLVDSIREKVAGGIGVAPMIFLVDYLIEQEHDLTGVEVFLGGRSKADLLCLVEFSAFGLPVHDHR